MITCAEADLSAQSYACGFTNVCSWIALCTGVAIIGPQLAVAMAVFWNPTYTPQAWQVFLGFQAVNGICLLNNIFLLRHTLWIHNVGRERIPHIPLTFDDTFR